MFITGFDYSNLPKKPADKYVLNHSWFELDNTMDRIEKSVSDTESSGLTTNTTH